MRTVLGWVSPADAVARGGHLRGPLQGFSVRRSDGRKHIRSLYSTNETHPVLRHRNAPCRTCAGSTTPPSPRSATLPSTTPTSSTSHSSCGRGRDSLYLLGRDGGARTLIGALTAEVAHQVRMVAAAMPDGRLDPPMTGAPRRGPAHLRSDPAARLDGGHGRSRLHAARRRAVPRAVARRLGCQPRRGDPRQHRRACWSSAVSSPRATCRTISTLCGNRLVAVDDDDNRPLPVMTPAEISNLDAGTALVLRNGLRPVVGRAPMIWDRQPSAPAKAWRRLWAAVIERLKPPRCGRSGRPAPPASSQARDGSGPDDRRRSTHDADGAPRAPGRRPVIRRVEPVDHSQALQRLGRDVELLRQDVARVSELSDAVTAHGRSIDQLAALVGQQAWLVEGGAIRRAGCRDGSSGRRRRCARPGVADHRGPGAGHRLAERADRLGSQGLAAVPADQDARLLALAPRRRRRAPRGAPPVARPPAWTAPGLTRWPPGTTAGGPARRSALATADGRAASVPTAATRSIGVEYAYDLACLDELAEWWATTHGTDADRPAPGLTVQKSGR